MENQKINLFNQVKNNIIINKDRIKSNKIYNPEDLVNLGIQNNIGESHIKSVTLGKLKIIAEQIKHLQNQAADILQEANINLYLNNAKCNFRKIKGKIYHLYEKNDEYFFSMLSPEEWNNKPPYRFVNSYKLEEDMSWTSIDELGENKIDLKLLGLTN